MEKDITKIVITGGPCAGKTSALEKVKEVFSRKGYTVIFVPETATELILSGIAPWTCDTNKSFQHTLLKLQLEKERIFAEGSQLLKDAGNILLVCDRGTMDNKAYTTAEEFADILHCMNLTEEALLAEYGAVFHLVTTAKGDMGYTLENNTARYESSHEAIALDDRLIAAWQKHPHRVIINNTSSFQEKINMLIDEISAFLG